MTAPASTAPTLTVETLPVLAHQGVRVITTEFLAQLYGTDPNNIRRNFERNEDRFVAGKHYFKLEGQQLRDFKREVAKSYSVESAPTSGQHRASQRGSVESAPTDGQHRPSTRRSVTSDPPDAHRATVSRSVKISHNIKTLMLWTERGTARHAKILDTDAAWEVFERLEDAYFAITPTTPPAATLLPSEQQTLSEIAHARVANQPPAVQGKALAEIWSRLHHKFRIARYDQLPRTELATAILYITALDLRALPRAPAPAPPDYLTPNDHRNLQRLIGWISAIGHYPKSLVAGIWYALRQATGVPAPHRFEVQHLPLIAAELQRILEGIFAYQRHRRDLEGELIARIVRGREPAAPFLAQLDREQRAWLDPLRPWQDKLESWHRGDVERLLERAPSRAGLLPGLEEPAAL